MLIEPKKSNEIGTKMNYNAEVHNNHSECVNNIFLIF